MFAKRLYCNDICTKITIEYRGLDTGFRVNCCIYDFGNHYLQHYKLAMVCFNCINYCCINCRVAG